MSALSFVILALTHEQGHGQGQGQHMAGPVMHTLSHGLGQRVAGLVAYGAVSSLAAGCVQGHGDRCVSAPAAGIQMADTSIRITIPQMSLLIISLLLRNTWVAGLDLLSPRFPTWGQRASLAPLFGFRGLYPWARTLSHEPLISIL